MRNRYRIQNKLGQILCHQDTAQKAYDIVCNLGQELCQTHMIVDKKRPCAFPYTTIEPDVMGFVGTAHKDYASALACLK